MSTVHRDPETATSAPPPAVEPPPDAPWVARFRAPRTGLPIWARDAPHRCVYSANPTGTVELYAWDRAAGSTRQLTDRPQGTLGGAIDPAGEWVWWFADHDGDEFGVWLRQPFDGGSDEPVASDLARSYPAGLAIGRRLSAIGRSDDAGSSIALVRPDGGTTTVYASEHDAHLVDLSRDERLVCLGHSEHGDSRHPALRVLTVDGEVVGDLWDGPGKGLTGVAFSPVAGDPRVLVLHERRGRPEPLLWDPTTGAETLVELDTAGDVEADWYADGSALLLQVDARARSRLYRHDLASGATTPLDTPPGTIDGATARPDGSVELLWSSSETPSRVRDLAGRVVLTAPGPAAPPSVPVEDVDADGPGGRVHGLLARPPGVLEPLPAVFFVHGGPTWHDRDMFMSERAAFVDAGLAVVHVNYRGSTGYGSQWRDALEGRPGLTELEDVLAVRRELVERGVVDPDRLALVGRSWGGYLTLLGLGTSPDLWRVGVATVPVADYVAAYEDEMEPLKAFDRSLFGGTPDEVPEVYRASSPLTYVEQVQAPVLVMAGQNDPRCPIRQIENYLARLAELGKTHEIYRYDAGHGSLVVDERIRQMAVELDFLRRHLAG